MPKAIYITKSITGTKQEINVQSVPNSLPTHPQIDLTWELTEMFRKRKYLIWSYLLAKITLRDKTRRI